MGWLWPWAGNSGERPPLAVELCLLLPLLANQVTQIARRRVPLLPYIWELSVDGGQSQVAPF